MVSLVLTAWVCGAPLTPLERDEVLRGQAPSYTFGLEVKRAGLVRFEIPVEVSELVEPTKSYVTLSVDDVPMLTRVLDERRAELILEHDLSAEYHVVQIQASLFIEQDPCLTRLQEHSWLKLSRETTVDMPAPASTPVLNLSDLLSKWRESEAGVRIVPDLPFSGAYAVERINAEDVFRQLGIPGETNSPNELQLSYRPGAGPSLHVEETRLILQASAPSEFRRLFQAIRSPRFATLCPLNDECAPSGAAEAPTDVSEKRDPAIVASFADVGYAAGLVFQGAGAHTGGFYWPVPAHWDLDADLWLTLNLSASAFHLLDAERSYLEVWVNDSPIGSVDLERWSRKRTNGLSRHEFKVRLPKSLRDADGLSVQLRSGIQAKNEKDCQALDTTGLWFAVGPGSHLVVERSERNDDGIAGFFRRASRVRPELSLSSARSWDDLTHTASILAPLSDLTPQRLWTLAVPETCADVVHPHPRWDPGIRLAYVPERSRPYDGALQIQGSSETGFELTMVRGSEWSAPALGTLTGGSAVLDRDQWHPLGPSPNTLSTDTIRFSGTPSASDAPGRLSSEAESKARKINIAWLLALLLVGGLLMWRMARRSSLSADELEVES